MRSARLPNFPYHPVPAFGLYVQLSDFMCRSDSMCKARPREPRSRETDHVSIGDIPIEERPRERMRRGGAVALSDAELIAPATVSPRDVFRFALSDHAASVILFHNHPSGDPSPSPQDQAFTTKLIGIGEALGVEILDHLIVTTSSFLSFKQRALL